MNRCSFLKRLGKVVTLPVVASLIKLPTADDPDVPIDFEDIEPYVQGCNSGSMHGGVYGDAIAKWDGCLWSSLEPTKIEARELVIDKDGVLHVGDKFTSP